MRRPIFMPSKNLPLSFTVLLGLFTSLVLFSGCDDSVSEDPPELNSENPEIVEVITPKVWNLGFEGFRQLKIKMEYPPDIRQAINQGGPDMRPDVTLAISLPDTTISLSLYDDGGYIDVIDNYEWTDTYSGDLAPNDYEYSIRINSLFTDQVGQFEVKYRITTILDPDDPVETYLDHSDTLEVLENRPPEILSFDVPDSLHSGFDESTWTAVIEDPDPGTSGELTSVTLKLFLDEIEIRQREFTQNSQNPDQWTLDVDASFAAALPTNTYRFEVDAVDAPGSFAETFIKDVWVENSTPIILSVETPDTVERPLEGTNYYDFFLTLEDLQGTEDIEKVSFEVKPASSNQFFTGDDYVFRDDGLFNDEVAEDGIWSGGVRIEFTDQSEDFGNWTFRYLVEDRAGNISLPFDVLIYYRLEGAR